MVGTLACRGGFTGLGCVAMRIADRYIGRQILFGTISGVGLLTVVLVLSQVFKEIRPYLVEQGAPLPLLGLFILYVLPFALLFTLPWGFLAAVLLSFGKLSSHNELISLRMAGQSLYRLAFPALLLGLVFSGISYWLNGAVAPKAKAALKALPYEAAKRDPKVFLNPGVVQAQFPGQKVYVEERKGDTLHGFHLYQLSDSSRDATPVSYVHADTVALRVEFEKKQFHLTLSGFFVETSKKDGTVELAAAAEAEPWFIDFSATSKKKMRPDTLTNIEISEALDDPETPSKTAKRLIVELNTRRSLSLACLAFALIGIPLGVTARRKETSTGLVLSLVVAAAYFSGMLFTKQLEDSPLPVIVSVLWLPNVCCLLLGFWLFHRASFR